MWQLISVPVLSDVVVMWLSLLAVLTPNDNFSVVSLLHSVRDLYNNSIVLDSTAKYNKGPGLSCMSEA
jgi:hypothetical protein